jgi:uncharacterized protein YneF (UPF0154 family)
MVTFLYVASGIMFIAAIYFFVSGFFIKKKIDKWLKEHKPNEEN